ncbi:metallophosphoesterase [Parachlamydia sp. AcF125]|uniref:metallophosphoesterase n=1 Tax=Parachlamydia sp. AcF125 TaxID=2795736 RepID=UPI001BD8D3E1|nr:metallophosphoesterase [Parachlamydia sp. AcF125]MBS4169178.1 hypothetical protein [Parachlamydia sp. AcF125]
MANRLSIDCISDTHSKHTSLKLGGGDILIHAGDCTSTGQLPEALTFLNWFCKQPYHYHLLIAGNHDLIFEKQPDLIEVECKKRNVYLLNDSGLEIEGIKIWGSPITPWFEEGPLIDTEGKRLGPIGNLSLQIRKF